jgi:hypothetical protein
MGIQTIPYPFRGYFDLYGQMQFSQDGKRWASTRCDIPGTGEVYIADFDRCTGMLSNFSKITPPPQATGFPAGNAQSDTTNVGLCFSPNGQQLYISRISHVMQYQFANNAFHKVCGMDTVYDYFAWYTNLGLGADNKIYIGHFHGTSKQISVIDNPDGQGAACNFCRKCLRSKNPETIYGLLKGPPNMPNYELGASGQPCWPLSSTQFETDSLQLAVYPNPASNVFYVQTHSKHKRELYTDIGQLLISTDLNEIDVSNYSKGIYYIKVGTAVRKLVVE